MGDGDRAVGLLTMMNPIERTRTPGDVTHYCGEPYVVTADVSAAAGRAGRSGWTWYTGSAAWMYRIWLEEVLGFKLRADTLTIEPVLPADWPGFQTALSIQIVNLSNHGAERCAARIRQRIGRWTIGNQRKDPPFRRWTRSPKSMVRMPKPLRLLPLQTGTTNGVADPEANRGFVVSNTTKV